MKHLSRALLVASLALAGAGSAGQPSPASAAVGPDEVGQWLPPQLWPVVAIHAFLLPTGKVLQFSFPGSLENPNAYVWNPTTGAFAAVPVDRPLFCSGHSFLADGRLLVTGGSIPGSGEGLGIKDTHIFDPFEEAWTRVEDMARGRWYPTNVTLADGRVLTAAGHDESGAPNTTLEVYEPSSGIGWQIVSAEVPLPLYPWMHVLSWGDVFYAGPSSATGIFSIETGSPYGVTWSNYGNRGGGMSVLLPAPPDRVMIIGGQGAGTVTATTEIIDLSEPAPAWRYTQSMNFPRMHANAVILPDGRILVIGGHSEMHDEAAEGPPPSSVYEAEIFDPETETWTLAAPMQIPRVYHSTALLLPDGRVLAGGSTGIGVLGRTVEIYAPPYLFQGPRPIIAFAPGRVAYGESFPIESPNTSDIGSVVLIRPSSVTHSVNMDERYLALQFTRSTASPDMLLAEAPSDPALAPPGYYMLFVLTAGGVPSTARFVRLVPAEPSPEITDDEAECQQRASLGLARFVRKKWQCITRCERRVRSGRILDPTECVPPFSGNTLDCITNRAEPNATKMLTSGKCVIDCPECYDAGDCSAFATAQVQALEQEVDALRDDVYCDDSASGDGLSKREAKCQNAVAKQVRRFGYAKMRCLRKCRRAEHEGRATGSCDPTQLGDTKTVRCIDRATQRAAARINKACGGNRSGDLPECFTTTTGVGWVTLVENDVDALDPDVFCVDPSP